ncbi:MAG TPA: MFS transporter [Acidimicrobiia bacterium]|nr:MFS transporter [Acidimicrobiia bacterium]
MRSPAAAAPIPLTDPRLDRRRWWALAVMCLSLAVITLDNTVLNVALPALIRDVHASTSQLQWIVDGYTLVFAGLLLTTGSLGDRVGRKRALSTGLAIFCVGSAASAFAGSAGALVFTRAFMGIGAALIMPATLSLLTNVFRDPKERARAIGAWAAVAGGGGALGPVIGGFLLKHFWWGSVFLVNVPIAAVALVAGRFLLPESRDPHAPRLDVTGASLSVAGLVAVLWAIIEAPTKGWSSPMVAGSLLLGVVVIAAFVVWELTCDHPMLDVRFFRNPRFSAANGAITMTFFAMYGSMFVMTMYLQNVLGYAPLEAGIRLLPMAAIMLVVAPLSPRVVEHIGTKLVVGGGLLLSVLGLVLMSQVTVSSGYTLLLVSMSILSTGMGFVMAPATESIMGSLPVEKAGVGSAMNDTTRQMGGALGVAVIGSVLAASYRPGMASRVAGMHLPAGVASAATDSVGGAVDAAARLPGPVGRALASAGHAEFVHAFARAEIVGAVVVLLAAIVVFAFLPARAHDARAADAGALDGVASLTFAEAEGALEDDARAAEPDVAAPVPRVAGEVG